MQSAYSICPPTGEASGGLLIAFTSTMDGLGTMSTTSRIVQRSSGGGDGWGRIDD